MRLVLILALLAAGPASAEVVEVAPSGMEIRHVVRIAAAPAAAGARSFPTAEA
jgi:hypothetical protein